MEETKLFLNVIDDQILNTINRYLKSKSSLHVQIKHLVEHLKKFYGSKEVSYICWADLKELQIKVAAVHVEYGELRRWYVIPPFGVPID